MRKLLLLLSCMCILFMLPAFAFAHASDIDFNKVSRLDNGFSYFKMGVEHIIPLGLDHILFVLGLFLLNPKLKSILWQTTTFTIAHSITLGLAMYGVIPAPGDIVEPLIALSILFIAVENLLVREINKFRLLIVFAFGLIHGLGFAGALNELGLPRNAFFSSLISFNIGVEFGQILVILIAYGLVGFWFSKKEWYRRRIVYPASIAIGLVACYWTIERLFFVTV